MASIQKTAAGYRAFVCKKRVRDSATFDSKTEAREWAARREAEIVAGARGEVIPRSVRAALRRYATEVSPKHKGERWECVRLTKFERELGFADKMLTAVTTNDVAGYRDRMLKGQRANGKALAAPSVRRELVLLRTVFEMCRKEWGWLKANPMTGMEWPGAGKPRTRRMSEDEIDRVLLAMNYERGNVAVTSTQITAVAYLWCIETTMRIGETLSLTHAQIDVAGRCATLIDTKNGDARPVPLSRVAIALLNCLPTDDDRVFPVNAGSRDTIFRKAVRRAGIENMKFHDSRHEAATRLARKLSNPLDLAKVLGHRNVNQVMTYYNPTPAEIADRMDA